MKICEFWLVRNLDNSLKLFNYLGDDKCIPYRKEEHWEVNEPEYFLGYPICDSLFPDIKWEEEPKLVEFNLYDEDCGWHRGKYYTYISNILPVTRKLIESNCDLSAVYKIKNLQPYDFLEIEEAITGDFYTDDGEYEMFLSDGESYIGTDISDLNREELEQFINGNKHKLGDDLKIYYIDYPEDK